MDFFSDIQFWSTLGTALLLGSLCGYLAWSLVRAAILRSAANDAADLVQEVRDRVELKALEEKERIAEIDAEIWAKEEPKLLEWEEKIEELEEMSTERKRRADDHYSRVRQVTVETEERVKKEEKSVSDRLAQLAQAKERKLRTEKELVDACARQSKADLNQMVIDQVEKLLAEARHRGELAIKAKEQSAQEEAEERAKHTMDTVLARFARAYSAERGIAGVYFERPEQRGVLCDPEGVNLKTISEITGCDLFVADDMDIIGVAGFDPVRRELTRRILERCLKEKNRVTPEFIRRAAENIKRELLALVRKDGDLLSKELGLQNLHPEIRQMMGSLRYRYSFTQNQYFHCGEVGWLCGLLAEELGGVDRKKARRSGMLHDLGKSMDHELDGGHAVIGANFIEARGEAPDIVYAVRAHHFDVPPAHDLDYLVIAADAISGARPGARRSTLESYNQKVTELQEIALSFDGVTDCFVLSGGRECRVRVNSKKVDDASALKLSQAIATRIENECNYPGQIKVVVVRETLSLETTR